MQLIQVGSYSFTWTFLFGMFCVGLGFGLAMLLMYGINKSTHRGEKTMRNLMYWLAKVMGDIKAISKGRIWQRLWNKGIMKTGMKLIRRLMK